MPSGGEHGGVDFGGAVAGGRGALEGGTGRCGSGACAEAGFFVEEHVEHMACAVGLVAEPDVAAEFEACEAFDESCADAGFGGRRRDGRSAGFGPFEGEASFVGSRVDGVPADVDGAGAGDGERSVFHGVGEPLLEDHREGGRLSGGDEDGGPACEDASAGVGRDHGEDHGLEVDGLPSRLREERVDDGHGFDASTDAGGEVGGGGGLGFGEVDEGEEAAERVLDAVVKFFEEEALGVEGLFDAELGFVVIGDIEGVAGDAVAFGIWEGVDDVVPLLALVVPGGVVLGGCAAEGVAEGGCELREDVEGVLADDVVVFDGEAFETHSADLEESSVAVDAPEDAGGVAEDGVEEDGLDAFGFFGPAEVGDVLRGAEESNESSVVVVGGASEGDGEPDLAVGADDAVFERGEFDASFARRVVGPLSDGVAVVGVDAFVDEVDVYGLMLVGVEPKDAVGFV